MLMYSIVSFGCVEVWVITYNILLTFVSDSALKLWEFTFILNLCSHFMASWCSKLSTLDIYHNPLNKFLVFINLFMLLFCNNNNTVLVEHCFCWCVNVSTWL